jgi:membrane protein
VDDSAVGQAGPERAGLRARVAGFAAGAGRRLGATFAGRVLARYGRDDCANLAAMVAFNLMFALIPLLLAIAGVAGLLLGHSAVQQQVDVAIRRALPAGGTQAAMHGVLRSFRQSSGVLGLVSLPGLVWGGSALFGSLETALDQVFRAPRRNFVRQKLMSVAMMLVFVVVTVVSVLASSAGVTLSALPRDVLPAGALLGVLTWGIGQLVGLAGASLFFGLLLWAVPNRHMEVRWVIPGAIAGGVLFQALTLLFPVYLRFAGHGFGWGSAFGLAFLLLTWLYFTAQLILITAEITVVANALQDVEPERRRIWRSRAQPATGGR